MCLGEPAGMFAENKTCKALLSKRQNAFLQGEVVLPISLTDRLRKAKGDLVDLSSKKTFD